MEINGYEVSGYEFLGTNKLLGIGSVGYYHDYRLGLTQQNYSGIDRVNSLFDSGPGSNLLLSGPSSTNTTRPKVLSGGIGQNNVSPVAVNLSAPYTNSLAPFHKGNPVFQMFVAKLDNTVGTQLQMCTTLRSGTPGCTFRIIPSNRQLGILIQNNAGTNIRSQITAVNSVPLNEFCVFAHLYYGSGTGSNNVKLWIKDSLTQFTSNPTYGTNDGATYNNFTTIGAVEFVAKMSIGYNLTGKTPAQCDAFAALAFETLIQDTEYSGLVIP